MVKRLAMLITLIGLLLVPIVSSAECRVYRKGACVRIDHETKLIAEACVNNSIYNKFYVYFADKVNGEGYYDEYNHDPFSAKIPVFFNGVKTGYEANPCSAETWFSNKTFIFHVGNSKVELSSRSTEEVFQLIMSGAVMDPF